MKDKIGIGSTLQYLVTFEGLTYDVTDSENVEFSAQFYTKRTAYDDPNGFTDAVIDKELSGESNAIICELADSTNLGTGQLWLRVTVQLKDDTQYKEILDIPCEAPLI